MSKEVGECGKTTEIYVPTVFENYVANIEVDRRQVIKYLEYFWSPSKRTKNHLEGQILYKIYTGPKKRRH